MWQILGRESLFGPLFLKDRYQLLLLILSKLKWINLILFPLKSSGNHRFSDNVRVNRSYSIQLDLLHIRSEIWRPSLCGVLIYQQVGNFLEVIILQKWIKKYIFSFSRKVFKSFCEVFCEVYINIPFFFNSKPRNIYWAGKFGRILVPTWLVILSEN